MDTGIQKPNFFTTEMLELDGRQMNNYYGRLSSVSSLACSKISLLTASCLILYELKMQLFEIVSKYA
jgi:hypothetical protein